MLTTLQLAYQHTKGDYLRKLIAIAIPITIQNILISSRGLVDAVMLAQLGEAEIAAIGVASKAAFIAIIMIVGMTTGGSLLIAQYWGANEKGGIRRSTALTVMTSLMLASGIVAFFLMFSENVMALATDSQDIIQYGSDYLVYSSFSLIAIAYAASMAAALRSVHKPGVSTFFSGVGIFANVFLNWVLIFGNLGFPEMGIKGAAIATVMSAFLEAILLTIYVYGRKHLLAFSFYDIVSSLQIDEIKRFVSLSLPVTINFLFWSGGLFAYNVIMGQTGSQGLAALSAINPVESMSLSFLIGIASASSVLVGNQIGAKKYEEVFYQAIGTCLFNFIIGVICSASLWLMKGFVLGAFTGLSPETYAIAEKFYLIFCIGIMVRAIPITTIVGILRAGGDIRYCFYQDIIAQWGIAVPLSFLGAFWFGLEPHWVYLLFLSEELFKCFTASYRMLTKKWIKNLIS
ncbi:MATE family efflux transporter [Vibrio sp.]|nr:MATE family efflux transporter [Vibrio sp.]